MSLLGQAALAMWWNVPPARRAEFADWHSHEHFPERMSIPGFRRGSRWIGTGEDKGFFVLYELERYETLTSKAYLDRLNAPTPWSTKMMPHHLGMVRSQCRVAASFGGGVAGSLATIRLSADFGREMDLKTMLVELLRELAPQPGLTGAHLLLTDTPKTSAPTVEERMRGADAVADWIVLLSGYDPGVVQKVVADRLSSSALRLAGASKESVIGHYTLVFTMTAHDLAAP
jgi:hypothetical protein